MAIYRQFADQDWEFADSAGFGFVESTDNLPIFTRNLPILAVAELRNPSIIHRFGCRNRSVESSCNLQTAPHLYRRSGTPNHQLIVNQFAVIVNSTALNPSTIHHQNLEIYHLAGRQPTVHLAADISFRYGSVCPHEPGIDQS